MGKKTTKMTSSQFMVAKHAKDIRRLLKNKGRVVSAKAIANL